MAGSDCLLYVDSIQLPGASPSFLAADRYSVIQSTSDGGLPDPTSPEASAVSSEQPRYPIVLRAGASAQVPAYATLAEDLASHGYVVVALDAPYRTGLVVFPDGHVVTRTSEDDPELYTGDALTHVAEKLLARLEAPRGSNA